MAEDPHPMTPMEVFLASITMAGPKGRNEELWQYEQRVMNAALDVKLMKNNLLREDKDDKKPTRFLQIAKGRVYKTTVLGYELVEKAWGDGRVGVKLKLILAGSTKKYGDDAATTGFIKIRETDGTTTVPNEKQRDLANLWAGYAPDPKTGRPGHDILIWTYTVSTTDGKENLGKEILHIVDLGVAKSNQTGQ